LYTKYIKFNNKKSKINFKVNKNNKIKFNKSKKILYFFNLLNLKIKHNVKNLNLINFYKYYIYNTINYKTTNFNKDIIFFFNYYNSIKRNYNNLSLYYFSKNKYNTLFHSLKNNNKFFKYVLLKKTYSKLSSLLLIKLKKIKKNKIKKDKIKLNKLKKNKIKLNKVELNKIKIEQTNLFNNTNKNNAPIILNSKKFNLGLLN
jgi:hypothetical protein